MKMVKVLLGISAFCSALCAVTLLWNESNVTCGYTTAKVFETLFIICALVLTKEYASLKV